MTEFDCPEVALCGWQDIKIQFTNFISAVFVLDHLMNYVLKEVLSIDALQALSTANLKKIYIKNGHTCVFSWKA